MEQLLNLEIVQTAYDEGVTAYWSSKSGKPVEPNPYVESSKSFTDWVQGWFEASEFDSDW